MTDAAAVVRGASVTLFILGGSPGAYDGGCRMIELTHAPLDVPAVLQAVESPEAGAVVLFLGTTRGITDGRETTALEYECYPQMAEAKLTELVAEARERWPLVACALVHRLGRLEVGEASVAIAVSAAHRQAAFEAGQWLIDTLKQGVPIWKREQWADGSSEWVHPSVELADSRAPGEGAP